MNTDNYQRIWLSNGLGGLFIFDNVPMDEDNDIVEWFDSSNVSNLVCANYSSCQWGLYCVGIDVSKTYDYIEETGEYIKKEEEKTISKEDLQQRIYDMEEDDNIWDILCDDYGLSPGSYEEEEK